MPQPKATKSQRRVEAKRKTDGELAPERPTKITAITKASDRQRRAQAANNKSKEGLFKANTAVDFGRRSAGQGSGSRVQVRQERQHVDGATTALEHPAEERSAIPMGRMSPLVVVPTPRIVLTTGNDVDQDDVIVAILSQDKWDEKMTKMTVDNLTERARDCISGGHLFDAAYLDRLLSRLDSAGITAERRSEVVGLLQTALKRSLSDWSAFVDQIGNRDSQRVIPCVPLAGTRRATSPICTTPNCFGRPDTEKSAALVGVRAARRRSIVSSHDQVSRSHGGEDQVVESDFGGSGRDDLPVHGTVSRAEVGA